MSEPNSEQPMFPVRTESVDKYGQINHDQYFGITKREYFAAMAMQARLAQNIDVIDRGYTDGRLRKESSYEIAKKAIADADELLKQLDK